MKKEVLLLVNNNTACKFAEIFKGNTKACGRLGDINGGGRWEHIPLTVKEYEKHLNGTSYKDSLGICPILDDGTVLFVAIDVDAENEEDKSELAIRAYEVKMYLEDFGITAYIEISKGKGYHIWVFFKESVTALKARKLVRIAWKEVVGGPIPEIFPKQNNLNTDKGFGNYINLPYFPPHSNSKRRVFVNGGEYYTLEEFLEIVKRHTAEELDNALVQMPQEQEEDVVFKKSKSDRVHLDLLPCIKSFLEKGSDYGYRRPAIFRTAAHLNASGYPYEAAIAIIEKADQNHNPSIMKEHGEKELHHHIYSAYYNNGGSGYTSYGCNDDSWTSRFCPGRNECPVFNIEKRKKVNAVDVNRAFDNDIDILKLKIIDLEKSNNELDNFKTARYFIETELINTDEITARQLIKYSLKEQFDFNSKDINDLSKVYTKALKEVKKQKSQENDNVGTIHQFPACDILENDGCYYHVKKTKEGPIPEKISNFVLEPLERLTTSDDEYLKVSLNIKNDHKPKVLVLSSKAFLGRRDFISALQTTKAQFLGTDTVVQKLVGYLNTKFVKEKTAVSVVGRHDDVFVTPKLVIDKNGIIEDPEIVYNNPNANTVDKHIDLVASDDWLGLVKKILPLIDTLHDPYVTYPLLGWLLTNPMAHIIRKKFNGYPHMTMWGVQGSGKTSLIRALTPLLGVYSSDAGLSCKTTKFILLKTLSATNGLPIYLDEYKPSELPKNTLDNLHMILRLAYNGLSDARGRKDQTQIDYPLIAPVILTGEARTPDPAIIERIILLETDKNYLINHKEARQAYTELTNLPLNEFAVNYIQQTLKWDINDILNKASVMVDKVVDAPPRIISNMKVVSLGLNIISSLAKTAGVELKNKPSDEDIIKSIVNRLTEEGKEIDPLEKFLNGLTNMITRGEIIKDREFCKDGKHLYISLGICLAEYGRYVKQYGLEKDFPGEKVIKKILKDKAMTDSYVVKSHGYSKKIGGKTHKCTVFDLYKMQQETGIEVDNWGSF